MNKLGMVAIVVALGIAGYMIMNHAEKNVDNVKIQGYGSGDGSLENGAGCFYSNDCKSGHATQTANGKKCTAQPTGDHSGEFNSPCTNGSDCKSHSCDQKRCAK